MDVNYDVKRRFDREKEDWDYIHNLDMKTLVNREVYKRKELTKNFLKNNFGNKKISILEIGCGAGNNIGELASINNEWTLKGVDISSKMIEYAQNNYASYQNISFEVLNIDSELLHEEFDVVILLGVVGYLNSNESSFKNIDEMLKEDGYLIFTYGNKSSMYRFVRNLIVGLTKSYYIKKMFNLIGKDIKSGIYFRLFNKTFIRKLLPKQCNVYREYGIGFVFGFMGKYSIILNKYKEKLYNNKDLLNQAFTKLLIIKKNG